MAQISLTQLFFFFFKFGVTIDILCYRMECTPWNWLEMEKQKFPVHRCHQLNLNPQKAQQRVQNSKPKHQAKGCIPPSQHIILLQPVLLNLVRKILRNQLFPRYQVFLKTQRYLTRNQIRGQRISINLSCLTSLITPISFTPTLQIQTQNLHLLYRHRPLP